MVTRFIGSGRQREGGFAAVHRQDFRAHTTGGDWRHTADQTDMNPSLSVLGGIFSSPTVQGTLQLLANTFSTAGQGFITIGDGYDMGDFNVGDPSTPSLHDAFNAAFASPRLQQGGVLLIKAGTYRLTQTVTVPQGMMIIGEGRGTVIISNTGEKAMFRIQKVDETFSVGELLATPQTIGRGMDGNKFWNMVLADNLDGYITSGGIPVPTMQSVPMIQCEVGSVLEMDQMYFLEIGRAHV